MRASSLLLAGLLKATFFQAVSARLCFFEAFNPSVNRTTKTTLTVYSQDEIDTKLKGCTSLYPPLIIGRNYTGDLVLPAGLANLTDGMENEYHYRGDGTWGIGSPNLTSISGPDVVEIGGDGDYDGLRLNASALASVSFENLQQVSNLEIGGGTPGLTLDFPALTTVLSRFVIQADFSSMNFPKLASVRRYMGIRNRGLTNSMGYIDETDLDGEYPPLNINFPSLEKVHHLDFTGNISNVSLPALTTATALDPDIGSNQKFHIVTRGAGLDLVLPLLSNASEIWLAGTFTKISFPALRHTDRFTIYSSWIPMPFDFTPLESARRVSLRGNFTSYDISSFKNVTEMGMYSTYNLKCEPGEQKWAEMGKLARDFYCYYKEPKKSNALPIGLGVGLGVPAILGFVGFCVWLHKRELKTARVAQQKPLPESETELGAIKL